MYIVIIISVVLAVSYKLWTVIKLTRVYRTYINKEGPLTGREAATMMMKREGYKSGFVIYNGKGTGDPFYGNVYVPDKNVFVMKREIMDGRNLLATCIGCQLAASAIRYHSGDLCRDISTTFMNEYALKYVYDQTELDNLETLKTAVL